MFTYYRGVSVRILPTSMNTPNEYIVTGMTCNHCALSVKEEVSEVPGVESVDVDLESGLLSVSGNGFDEQQIKAAVTEAGYEAAAR